MYSLGNYPNLERTFVSGRPARQPTVGLDR
jgi:hypothetical protein